MSVSRSTQGSVAANTTPSVSMCCRQLASASSCFTAPSAITNGALAVGAGTDGTGVAYPAVASGLRAGTGAGGFGYAPAGGFGTDAGAGKAVTIGGFATCACAGASGGFGTGACIEEAVPTGAGGPVSSVGGAGYPTTAGELDAESRALGSEYPPASGEFCAGACAEASGYRAIIVVATCGNERVSRYQSCARKNIAAPASVAPRMTASMLNLVSFLTTAPV